MANSSRKYLPAIAIGLILAGIACQPPVLSRLETVATWIGIGQSGPVDSILVVEETLTRTPEQANVLYGRTSQAARAAKKWKMLDINNLPDSMKSLAASATKDNVPWMIVIHGGKATWTGPLPTTEAALSSRIQQQGGF